MAEKKKILVIEDDPFLSKVVILRMEEEGVYADMAEDGEEGMRMLNKNKYALVLLDLLMPKKDGYSVIDEIREKKINIPVVIFSNLAKNDAKLNYTGVDIKEYFLKANHTMEEVVKMVKFYLSKKAVS